MLSTSPSDSAPLLQIGDRALTAAELVQSLGRYQLILPLVRQVVLEQALISVECSPKEQAQAIQSFYEQQQITDAAQRLNWCQKQRLTETDIQHLAVQSIKLEKFKHATWASQVESYFLKRKSQLDRVIYRLIRTQDAHLAQEIYLRLQDDHASFADLARTYSQGPEAQTGGLVGPVELKTPHPTVAKLLSVSQPQQLSPLTRLDKWFIILQLEKLIPSQLDESMRKQLINELFQQWLQEQIDLTTCEFLQPASRV